MSEHSKPRVEAPRPPAPRAAVLWLAVRALASWPWPAALASLAAFLRRLGRRRSAETLDLNITRVWGLPPQSSFARRFARQVQHSQILVALESLRAILQPRRLNVEGYEELQGLLQKYEAGGRGQLVVTAHLGSWELVGMLCARAAGKPFYALAKPTRSPLLTDLLARLRSQAGALLVWTERKSMGRQMLMALQQGAWLGFVMDQKPQGRRGPLVQFFGQPTPFVGGPASMAMKYACPVVAVFCVRQGPMHYRVLSHVIPLPEPSATAEQELTQAMASVIEGVIRLYPEQWCWDYKRWRFDP